MNDKKNYRNVIKQVSIFTTHFNMQLGWCILIQTIRATILRQWLVNWMHSDEGKKLMKASGKATQTNKRMGPGICIEGDKKPEGGGNQKNKSKQTIKTQNGLKTVMSMLAEEQKTNKYLIYAFQYTHTTYATPTPHIKVVNDPTPLIGSLQARFLDNSVKIQSILQNN